MKKSIAQVSFLPEKFWEVILIFTFVLALSPFLSGMDFGVIKVPVFSPYWNAILFPIGIGLFSLSVLSFVPFWKIGTRANRGKFFFSNLCILIGVLVAAAALISLATLLITPKVSITTATLEYISPRGTAHLKVTGTSSRLFNNDFKIFVFTNVDKHPDEWWFDEFSASSFNPKNGEWTAEAIVGGGDDPKFSQFAVNIIAIATTEAEMALTFSKNKSADGTVPTFIRYPEKFAVRSEISPNNIAVPADKIQPSPTPTPTKNG